MRPVEQFGGLAVRGDGAVLHDYQPIRINMRQLQIVHRDELVTANEAESPEAETLEEALLENPEESA